MPLLSTIGSAAARAYGLFGQTRLGMPTFTVGTYRAGTGFVSGGRVGWTLNTIAPNNYDDGFAQITGTLMPVGTSWFMNDVSYTNYFVSTNGFVTFGTGSGIIPYGVQATVGLYLCPSDNYWGTNGANGTGNTPSGLAYRYGTTSLGYKFFSLNMQGYAYGNSSIDRSWELNCFYNDDNSAQAVEYIYSSSFSNASANQGVYSNAIYSSSTTGTSSISLGWQSSANPNKGTVWTFQGAGRFNVGTF